MVCSPLRIAIVGAGSSGLLLASLLHQHGHAVDVFEKAERIRADGCGILLVKSGVEALASCSLDGLLERILAQGTPVSRFVVRNLRGDLIESAPAQREPGDLPSLLIHRRAILEALAGLLPAERLHTGTELLSWRQDSHGTNPVEALFTNGQRWQGDVLVGADGLFSRVAPLVAPERRLNYLGDRVWRGVVRDDTFCRDGEFFVYARGRGVYANVFDLGQDSQGHPLTHWGLFQEEPLPAESEQRRQLLRQPVPEEALAKVPDDLATLIRGTSPEAWVANWSYDIDPLPRLHEGRAVIIGDAAHAMSSSQARGMTAGLEDAVSLAVALASVPPDGLPLPAALERVLSAWAQERLPVVHGYQTRSRAVSSRTGRKRPTQVLGPIAFPAPTLPSTATQT